MSVFSIWFFILIGIAFLAVAGMVFAAAYFIHYLTTKNKNKEM